MKTAEIKLDLHNKIDNVASKQLKEIYGLVINYLNSNNTVEKWDALTEAQKNKIMQGLDQADAGLGTPAKEVIKRARETGKEIKILTIFDTRQDPKRLSFIF
jgi:predicted transcriptional regulator